MRERKREGEREVKIVSRDVNNYHASNLQKVINKKAKKKKKKLNFNEQLKSWVKKIKASKKKLRFDFFALKTKESNNKSNTGFLLSL